MLRCGEGPSANCLDLSHPKSSSHPKLKPVFCGRNQSPSILTELLNEEFGEFVEEKVVGGSLERLFMFYLFALTL